LGIGPRQNRTAVIGLRCVEHPAISRQDARRRRTRAARLRDARTVMWTTGKDRASVWVPHGPKCLPRDGIGSAPQTGRQPCSGPRRRYMAPPQGDPSDCDHMPGAPRGGVTKDGAEAPRQPSRRGKQRAASRTVLCSNCDATQSNSTHRSPTRERTSPRRKRQEKMFAVTMNTSSSEDGR